MKKQIDKLRELSHFAHGACVVTQDMSQPRGVSGAFAHVGATLGMVITELMALAGITQPEDEIKAELMSSSIEKLNLPRRVFLSLKAENVNTVGELVAKAEDSLAKTPDLGRKSLREIKGALAELGLSLAVNS